MSSVLKNNRMSGLKIVRAGDKPVLPVQTRASTNDGAQREIYSRMGARHYTAMARETSRWRVILEPQLGAKLKRARPADLIQRIQTAQPLIQHLRR